MSDKELLELAARAAGFLNWTPYNTGLFVETGHSRGSTGYHWNPLTDDGDALRLAVKLGVELVFTKNKIGAGRRNLSTYPWVNEDRNVDDPYAATRRTIVRAAAAIGARMEAKP